MDVLISKVMLEEKVFMTWHSGGVVLLGDGAVTAMHDAITLTNLLYAMPTRTPQDLTTFFEEYQAERHPAMTEASKSIQLMSKFMEKGIIGATILFILAKTIRCRPQIWYLEPIALSGSIVRIVSPSEQKAQSVFEKQQKHV
ncbi:hypothetical protein BGZ47_007320 [Haplosporangium gracile]|nr:hypothetical protein BGZ47_007320 [Haplosporangium gracile]